MGGGTQLRPSPALGGIVSDLLRAIPYRQLLQSLRDILATGAAVIDEGMARAVFGPRPEPGGVWPIRPSTRFQLKAGLHDCGLLSSGLAPGAGNVHGRSQYEPARDIWHLAW